MQTFRIFCLQKKSFALRFLFLLSSHDKTCTVTLSQIDYSIRVYTFVRYITGGYSLIDYDLVDRKAQAPLAFKSLPTILIVEDSL